MTEDGEVVEVGNISGLNKRQRNEFYENPNEYKGKVFEASGKDVYEGGALRHPSFERWRPNKLPHECKRKDVLQSAGYDV
jgi:ATP-dependent DNA ligase